MIVELDESERIAGSSHRRSVIVDAHSGRHICFEVPRLPGKLTLPTLHKTLDQGAIGWPAAIWMDVALGLRGSSTEDKWHRWHNDLKEALVAAGCWLKVCEKTVIYNASTAPWGGHAFHGVLAGAARQYFEERDERCPLFQLFYQDRDCISAPDPGGCPRQVAISKVLLKSGKCPSYFATLGVPTSNSDFSPPPIPPRNTKDICREKDIFALDEGSPEHQRYVFQLIRNSKKFKSKGRRVKLGRWQSWFKATGDWKGERTTVLLILVFAGLMRGWFSSIDELPFGPLAPCAAAARSALGPDARPALCDGAASDSGVNVGRSASASSSCRAPPQASPDVAMLVARQSPADGDSLTQVPAGMASGAVSAPGGQPRTVKASNDELRKVRAGCKNTLHFCALALGCKYSNQITDMIYCLCEPANIFFDMGLTMTKTRRGSLEFHLSLCNGGFKRVIHEMSGKLVDPETIRRIGFLTAEEAPYAEPGALQQDGHLSNLMLLVWMNVSKNMLLSTMTYSHRLPGFLIGVLDPDVERRRAALGRIRVWYDLLQRADRQSQKDAWVRNFMFSLIWPGMTFVRETLALLCEVNFEEPTQEVLMHIRGFAESFLSTRIDEDVFNRCRQTRACAVCRADWPPRALACGNEQHAVERLRLGPDHGHACGPQPHIPPAPWRYFSELECEEVQPYTEAARHPLRPDGVPP